MENSVQRHPVTPGQHQVWFFDQLVPDGTFHTLPVYVDIEGPLDTGALAAALDALVNRHEPLRTTFQTGGSGPVPVVATDVQVPIRHVDLTAVPQADRPARVRAETEQEIRTRIDTTPGGGGLPLRAALLRLDDHLHRLVLPIHHIAWDGASAAILQAELLTAYGAAATGGDPRKPALPVGYAELMSAGRAVDPADPALAQWCRELTDLPEPLELPGAHTRPVGPEFDADTVPFVVPRRLADEIRALAGRTNSSVFMVLLTGFALVLSRSTGARDLVIGTPAAGRERAEAQDMVGYFVNMLALRIRIGWDPTLRELMAGVRDTVLAALHRRTTPFYEIVQAVQPQRGMDRHPVFQIVFASPPPLAGPREVAGCTFTFIEGTSRQALYDLEVQLPDGGSADMRGFLKYRTALYDRDDISALASRYVLVLEQLAGNPDARLSNLSLLTPAQRRRVVVDFNDTGTGYPADATVVELFERQVAAWPDRTAVRYGGRQLTYRELDRRANQLANHLVGLGVGIGSRVGVCLDRGVDWVVTAAAVVKAGGAYVPFDPEYPVDRLAWLCTDSGAELVVVDSGERPPPDLPDARHLDLATCHDDIAAEPADPPRPGLGPDDLAYVMYTSGSTGMPKGSGISHRNIVRLVMDTDYVEFRPGDRVAQSSTTTFDAATFEVWGALLAGATLIGLPKDTVLDPALLQRWLRHNEIDVLFLTTALAMHVAAEAPHALTGLRHFVFGGEQPDLHPVARLAELADAPRHIVNAYGPTETATFAGSHRCNGITAGSGRIPLGRPLANSTLYVLDQYLQPVPPKVVGELYIGGDGVGWGYVNSPDLTAQRFLPDHLCGRPGTRMYRTGDLARLLPNGTVEFLGRADRQVKIRGFRIEPGEIENCMQASGLVRQAVVVPRADAGRDVRLVGYAVFDETTADPTRELMAYLRASLPDHLVPSELVPLEALPLTFNAKLDLRALPEPAALAGCDDVDCVDVDSDDGTPEQQRMASVWREVLGVERIARNTTFFDLGGHSLTATRLISRVSGEFAVEVPLRALFDNPTLAGFTGAVQRLCGAAQNGVTEGPRATERSGLSIADLLETVDHR